MKGQEARHHRKGEHKGCTNYQRRQRQRRLRQRQPCLLFLTPSWSTTAARSFPCRPIVSLNARSNFSTWRTDGRVGGVYGVYGVGWGGWAGGWRNRWVDYRGEEMPNASSYWLRGCAGHLAISRTGIKRLLRLNSPAAGALHHIPMKNASPTEQQWLLCLHLPPSHFCLIKNKNFTASSWSIDSFFLQKL